MNFIRTETIGDANHITSSITVTQHHRNRTAREASDVLTLMVESRDIHVRIEINECNKRNANSNKNYFIFAPENEEKTQQKNNTECDVRTLYGAFGIDTNRQNDIVWRHHAADEEPRYSTQHNAVISYNNNNNRLVKVHLCIGHWFGSSYNVLDGGALRAKQKQ